MASIDDAGIDRWFVGGGAEHTPESVRRSLFTVTGGAEGVCEPTDLQVLPLEIPGGGVRVTTGSALMRSGFLGGATQTYQGTVFRQVEVPIAPNSTGTARTDLIALVVEDSFAAGSTYPEPSSADIPDEQYVYVRVFSGVSPTVTKLEQVLPGGTGIALARVTLPATTGTVTAAMVTNLRAVAIPKRSIQTINYSLIAGQEERLTAEGEPGEVWPNAFTNSSEELAIPVWATRVRVSCWWLGVSAPSAAATVAVWARISGYGVQPALDTQRTSLRANPVLAVADWRSIPAAMRGTSQRVYPMASLMAPFPSAANRPLLDAHSSLQMQFEFEGAAAS